MTQDTSDRHSFILRIWREGKSQEWKGWLQHAESGDAILFRTSNELVAFIEHYTGELLPPTPHEHFQNGSQGNSGLK